MTNLVAAECRPSGQPAQPVAEANPDLHRVRVGKQPLPREPTQRYGQRFYTPWIADLMHVRAARHDLG